MVVQCSIVKIADYMFVPIIQDLFVLVQSQYSGYKYILPTEMCLLCISVEPQTLFIILFNGKDLHQDQSKTKPCLTYAYSLKFQWSTMDAIILETECYEGSHS